jgi:hypothetical protein
MIVVAALMRGMNVAMQAIAAAVRIVARLVEPEPFGLAIAHLRQEN